MAKIFDCNQVPAADVNATQLSTVKECEPTSKSVWQKEQPNEISAFNADYTPVSRNPISTNRAARKGTISDVEVAPAFQTDVTIGTAEYWIPPFLYSDWNGIQPVTGKITEVGKITLDSPLALPFDTVIEVSGSKVIKNNAVYTVTKIGNDDPNTLNVDGLELDAENPITVSVVGAKTNVSLDKGKLTIPDNTYKLPVGSQLFIKDKGFIRVREVLSDTEYLVDNHDIEEPMTSALVEIYFSSFVSNVAQDSPLYKKTQLTMEAKFNTTPVTYRYARAVEPNQLTINAPLTDKMNMDMTFIAQEMQTVSDPLPEASHVDYKSDEALNTVTNISRVRIADLDEKGLSTYMKDVTLTINNNAQGEKVLGKMGSAFTSLGDLEVTMNTETVMTDANVLKAIENNTSVDFTLACKNGDGALIFNIPTATISNGALSMSRGEKVKVGTDLTGYLDDHYGFVIGVSLFKYLP